MLFRGKSYQLMNKKNIRIRLIIIVFMLLLCIGAFVLLKSRNSNKSSQKTKEQLQVQKTTENQETDNIVSGLDVKTELDAQNQKDYAILITTTSLLEKNDTSKPIEYLKYIIKNDDSNVVQEIKDINGKYRNAACINYNRLLADNVIRQDIGDTYMTPYGFLQIKKKEDGFHRYRKSKYIEIDDDMAFEKRELYDSDYNEIGCVYIETNRVEPKDSRSKSK